MVQRKTRRNFPCTHTKRSSLLQHVLSFDLIISSFHLSFVREILQHDSLEAPRASSVPFVCVQTFIYRNTFPHGFWFFHFTYFRFCFWDFKFCENGILLLAIWKFQIVLIFPLIFIKHKTQLEKWMWGGNEFQLYMMKKRWYNRKLKKTFSLRLWRWRERKWEHLLCWNETENLLTRNCNFNFSLRRLVYENVSNQHEKVGFIVDTTSCGW